MVWTARDRQGNEKIVVDDSSKVGDGDVNSVVLSGQRYAREGRL